MSTKTKDIRHWETYTDHYTIERFLKVINLNVKHEQEVCSSGRIGDPQQQAIRENTVSVMVWAKKWIDRIKENEKYKQKEAQRKQEIRVTLTIKVDADERSVASKVKSGNKNPVTKASKQLK